MKTESKRLFISDLPEGLVDEDLDSKFSHYGNVTSVEIKQRKDVSSKHSTDRFAYINIDIDHGTLQRCFEEFSRNKWKGHYIQIQLAKESFLERLKREREEANKSQVPNEAKTNGEFKDPNTKPIFKTSNNKMVDSSENDEPKLKKLKPTQTKDSSSSESSSDSDDDDKQPVIEKKKVVPNVSKADEESSSSSESSDSEEEREQVKKYKEELAYIYEDMIIKNNRYKKVTKNIESCGKEPIVKIEKKKPKSKDPSRMQADQKRIKSMQEMKKGYDRQKSAIKMALAKVDAQKNNKIVFDEDGNNGSQEEVQTNNKRKISNGDAHEESGKKGKMALFNEESDAEEDDNGHKINFELKKQFEGKKGQKLMELQTKFKSDHRFQMDERFLEEDDEDQKENEDRDDDDAKVVDDNEHFDDKVTQQEKQKQLEILEQVLGKKITKLPAPTTESNNKVRKTMLRFDPDQPNHSKYEVHIEKTDKKKKKKKDAEAEEQKEELPEVSKEIFYEVKDAFKPVEKTTEEGGFSLLSMFGRTNEDDKKDEESDDEESVEVRSKKPTEMKKKSITIDTRNPFKYDSSDDERDETKEKNDKAKKQTQIIEDKSAQPEPAVSAHRVNLGGRKLWTEPFFFRNDDYRFQEGIDFVKKLEHIEQSEFTKLRRDLKMIVRVKYNHNQRNNRMFKKKLGGGHKGNFKKFRNKKTQKK